MAPLSRTIIGRIMIAVLAIHLFALPVLYFGMVFLIKQSNEELFLNSVRGHARFLADSLERVGDSASDQDIIDLLDTIVLSGTGLFSELSGDSTQLMSSLVTEVDAALYEEDFKLQQHGDNVYFFSVPVHLDRGTMNLRVGFDETPYLELNQLAYRNGLIILAAYLATLMVVLPLIGRRVVRPIKELQRASRHIASGELSGPLAAQSDLIEFVELSRDLELMKDRLVGMNEQLQQEIRDKEAAELQRVNLEHQLRHSQRLETIGTMAGGIAHELNNILLPIILFTDTALEDLPADSPARADLRRVLKAATRARGIVHQVLTFSRKISGSEHIPLDTVAVVGDAVDLIRASMPAYVDLSVDIDPECPKVLGDASLLSQLVLNLCTNAFQSLEGSGGTVNVSLGTATATARVVRQNASLKDVKCVRLSVNDSGEGMDQPTLDRIFEPFFTTRGVGKGTGLGLSVVHGIVTDFNGAIEVRSALKSGAEFHVYLPEWRAALAEVEHKDVKVN